MLDILMSTLRLAIPLIFAAYGGMLSERSGIANIGLEAYLLISAFTAAAVTHLSGSLIIGCAAAILVTAFLGALFASICIWGRGDQIVIGTAMNMMAAGLIPIITKTLFDVTGSTPSLPIELRLSHPLVFLSVAILFMIGLFYMFKHMRHGLRIVAAGHNPLALSTQGVSFNLLRLRAVIEGAAIASIGGIYLSLCMSSGYIRNMSAGRGFLALAALIFGSWKPIPTFLACLFFGFTDSIQIRMQGVTWDGREIPNQFIQILPFVATLLLLIIFSGRMKAPRAINQDIR